ncbi:methyltransferase domain-containing protein [Collinsella sp. CLA-AA-H302]|uniref:class I SAM-dependent methyltransferase n=1 Tax=Collinsella sp. CLA-AA-H302 TaxID=3136217 RepID=UPI0032C19EB9
MSFFENTRKPVGLGGKIMVSMMNLGHAPVATWGLEFLHLSPEARVLDCGCGGGANMKRLLKKCPHGIVKGIDYSPVSVEKTKKVNEAAIAEGHCAVLQGSVADMSFADDWFDVVTAFETVYFWPNLPECFQEVYRVLKPGGTFLICNESNGDTNKDEKWTDIIGGMTIYKGTELKTYLEQAGFRDIQIHKTKSWLCVTGSKQKV